MEENAIVVPFAVSQNEMGAKPLKCSCGGKNTELFINDVKVGKSNKGEFFEDLVDRAKIITSNNPILVGGYKKTTNDTCGS